MFPCTIFVSIRLFGNTGKVIMNSTGANRDNGTRFVSPFPLLCISGARIAETNRDSQRQESASCAIECLRPGMAALFVLPLNCWSGRLQKLELARMRE